jgi:hypothetical protein
MIMGLATIVYTKKNVDNLIEFEKYQSRHRLLNKMTMVAQQPVALVIGVKFFKQKHFKFTIKLYLVTNKFNLRIGE